MHGSGFGMPIGRLGVVMAKPRYSETIKSSVNLNIFILVEAASPVGFVRFLV
jgi:hypothetical protein